MAMPARFATPTRLATLDHNASRIGVLSLALAAAMFGCASSSATNRLAHTIAAPSDHIVAAGRFSGASVTDDGLSVVSYPQHPALSPDGQWLTFAFDDDIWISRSTGGTAKRLTNHPATERRSSFNSDGTRLVFESNRDGARNIYEMPLITTDMGITAGAIKRITSSDRNGTLNGYAPNGVGMGGGVMYSAYRYTELHRHAKTFIAPIDGGPVVELFNAFGHEASASDEGTSFAFTRGRYGYDRPKYRGSGASDIWMFDSTTNQFTQRTSFNCNDGQPQMLPDGSVVFVSSRDGQNNVWKLDAGATDNGRETANGLTQLTSFHPAAEQHTIAHGVRELTTSHSGNRAAFVVWDTIYTLDLTDPNAQPQALAITAPSDTDSPTKQSVTFDSADQIAMSPDGKTVAMVDHGEIFLRATAEDRPTRRVTNTPTREADIAWSPDNQWLYFSSDRSGEVELYRASVVLTRGDLDPNVKAAEKAKKEAAEAKAKAKKDKEDAKKDTKEDTKDDDEDDDEKDGDKDDTDTDDGADDEDEDKEKDDEEKIDHGKRWEQSITFSTEKLIDLPGSHTPMPSPDGRKLLFIQGRGNIMMLDLKTMQTRTVFPGWNEPDIAWASDSRHIVYAVQDLDFNADVFILDALDADAVGHNVSMHPDLDHSPALSADGKVLTFLSDRDSDNFSFDVYAVYLDKALEGMTDYEITTHFQDAAKAAKKRKMIEPVDFSEDYQEPDALTFDFDDAYLRIRRLVNATTSNGNLAILPGGDRIVFSDDGKLHSVDYAGKDRKEVVSGRASQVSVSLDGTKLYMIHKDSAASVSPTGGKVKSYAMTFTDWIDLDKQYDQKFHEAARLLRDGFYHPTLKGLDWTAITNRYSQLASGTRTTAEFNRVVNMLFGELDGSHLGISGGSSDFSAPSTRAGYLGVDAVPVHDGYEITHIIKNMPADEDNADLQVGDVIVSIDQRALAPDGTGPNVDLVAVMQGTLGREILMDIRRGDTQDIHTTLIVPSSYRAESTARYNDAVAHNRARVDELSGGKLGYLHIRGMNMASVRVYERDLFAAANGKAGLIIDVRDNGGGSTTDILLASLTAPNHAYTVPRGADGNTVPRDSYPRDRRLIYGYSRPINVLMNQHSFSNAEIFSHSIKTVGRGKLVGTATFGGVISTGSASLIDGSRVRMPFRGWYLPDGTDMESHGAQPDVDVPALPADEVLGRDAQLEAAVTDLLGRVD